MAKAEVRRDTTVRSVPSKSFGIYFDSRTCTGSSGWPLVPMAGPLRWAVDSAGGTKSANPSGSGFLRGALPDRVLFLCWCGRSGGAPASASALMTATDGPQARLTIERHSALGSAGQHVSVDVSGLGILSLPLRPLYPNLLVTGVLGYACLGTCVFQLTSLLACLHTLGGDTQGVGL